LAELDFDLADHVSLDLFASAAAAAPVLNR
jgi:hypothetical protein